MESKKKRAFTLTELLVVVIVIGVLSAVVLPKFNKIIETRKTTEAEEMMAAVRTEQEQRCSLNKLYTNDFTKLTNVIPSNSTKNYTYNFTQNLRGVSATSKGSYKYTLKMPSYADGRICCDTDAPGNQCDKLNKDYPPCNQLIARADYTATEESCNPPIPCPGASEQSCGCNNSGTQTRTCDTTTGQWSAWSACQGVHCECAPEGGYTNTRPCGCNNSGTQTRTCNTSTGTWGAWGSCTVADCECTNGQQQSRECNQCGSQTRTCSNGFWGGYGSCTGTSAVLEGSSCSTTNGLAGTNIKTCQGSGYWASNWSCRCNPGATTTETGSCPSGYSGTKTRTCTCTNSYGTSCGNWDTSGCVEIECTGNATESCTPSGANYPTNCGTRTHYCNTSTHKWKTGSAAYSACSGNSSCCDENPGSDPCTCLNGYPGTQQWSCTAASNWRYHYDGCGSCTPPYNGCSESNKPHGSCCISYSNCGCYPSADIGGNGYVLPEVINKDFDGTLDKGHSYNTNGRLFSFHYATVNCPAGTVWSCGCGGWGTWKNCSCVTGTWNCTCAH